jgi:restriction system protein
MIEHNTQNVGAAFDVLIEEMEDALRSINNRGAKALEVCNYEMAQMAIKHARHVMLLCEKITALKGEWKELDETLSVQDVPEKLPPHVAHVQQQTSMSPVSAKPRAIVQQEAIQPVGRLIAGRIRKGLRTPETAFFCPILQALSDVGGSAKRSEVFLILEQSMKDVLKPIDYHILSSEAEQIRWQNSAQWARNLMVKEGLLRADSPVGIWEITEKGRAWLLNNCH